MSLFTASLLTMKGYVKVFQQNEPAIYRIYPEQLNVFREFLVDFIKPEVIAENKKVSQLKKVDFKSRKNQLLQSLISIGSVAYKIVKNFFFFFLKIGIHSMQGSAATTRHGVTRKGSTKRLKHTGNLFRKNLQLKDIC